MEDLEGNGENDIKMDLREVVCETGLMWLRIVF
jgi:hypothetical protein